MAALAMEETNPEHGVGLSGHTYTYTVALI